MEDDFNSAEAIGVLFEMAKEINKTGLGGTVLKECGSILGLFFSSLTPDETTPIPNEIQQLAQNRFNAKQNKDYATADNIRDQINAAGFNIKDTPTGYELTKTIA